MAKILRIRNIPFGLSACTRNEARKTITVKRACTATKSLAIIRPRSYFAGHAVLTNDKVQELLSG